MTAHGADDNTVVVFPVIIVTSIVSVTRGEGSGRGEVRNAGGRGNTPR
jgi:hypothetical protein